MQRELARPGVTRQLLWEEYKAAHPEGLQYTAFCVRLERIAPEQYPAELPLGARTPPARPRLL